MVKKKVAKVKKSNSVIPAKAGIKTKSTTKLSLRANAKQSNPVVAKTTKSTGLTVKVIDMTGKSVGTVILPKEIFGQTTNQQLLAQAMRVYKANSIKSTSHTKTRGEVRGGGKKPWRQKGTGNARAGSIRSPLWRGGGITFGPRYRDIKLTLPQKMRHKALIYALSQKATAGEINVISNVEKITPKTKPVSQLLKKLNAGKNTLLVISQKNENVKMATRNIQSLTVEPVQNLNAYEVLNNNNLLISKEALSSWT